MMLEGNIPARFELDKDLRSYTKKEQDYIEDRQQLQLPIFVN
jgi:hypothetical protein